MMKISMLEILNNAKVKTQEEEIKQWQEEYKDIKLENWSFDAIKEWAKNMEDKDIKKRIEAYIEIFEEKLA